MEEGGERRATKKLTEEMNKTRDRRVLVKMAE